MSVIARWATAVAAFAVVAVAGISLTDSDNGSGPSPLKTAPPASFAALPARGGPLPAGTYFVDVLPHGYDIDGRVETSRSTYRVTFDVPSGWTGTGSGVTRGGSSSTAIALAAPHVVYDTPCDSSAERSTLADSPRMRTPAGFTGRLAEVWQGGSNPATAIPQDPRTLGNRAASYIEIAAPLGIDFSECRGGKFLAWEGLRGEQRWFEEPGQLDRVWVVTIHPGLLLVVGALEPDASATAREEQDLIIRSMRIEVLRASAP